LKAIVQEIVNRGGWASGNAIALIFSGENQGPSDVENAREMEAFENISDPGDEDSEGNKGDGKNHPERAPKLVVYFNGFQTTAVKTPNSDKQLFTVYPAVVSNGFITITASETMNPATICIVDITGKTVLEQESREINTGTTLDIRSLSKGMYFVSIQNGLTKSISRIIVE
jgi:hypothetical protein